MTYAQDLVKVGLFPDNPDNMYKNLLLYIANPKAFKDRDSLWPGAHDNLSWWEDPKGTATLNWPFHGGKWYDNVPKNDAQYRAVFKAPPGISTKVWLSKVWGFPMSIQFFRMRWEPAASGNGGFDVFKEAGKIVDEAGNLLRDIPGVKEGLKLYIDLDFAALGALINTFIPSPASDILHGLSSVAEDEAKRKVDDLGPKSPPEIVDMILKELHFLGDALTPVRYFVERMLTANRFDADFFMSLLTFTVPPDASDHVKALAVGAKDAWMNAVTPPIKQIVPPLTRMIISMATTGKIMKSDLLALIGGKKGDVIDKILDLFGVDDKWPNNVANATKNMPTVTTTVTVGWIPGVITPGKLKFYEVLGQKMISNNSLVANGRKLAGNGTRGWDIGLGMMSQKIDAIEVLAVRQQLSGDDLKGFDMACSVYTGILTHPPSKAPIATQVAFFATKGMVGQPAANQTAITKAVTASAQGKDGAIIAAKQITDSQGTGKQLVSIAGGTVAGLAIAGPVGAAIGAAVGWGVGKLLLKHLQVKQSS